MMGIINRLLESDYDPDKLIEATTALMEACSDDQRYTLLKEFYAGDDMEVERDELIAQLEDVGSNPL